MKNSNITFRTLAFGTALLATALSLSTPVSAGPQVGPRTQVHNQEKAEKLLSVNFESRQVEKIEAGDFHFVPGQPAPIHSHEAPAIGYVVKGRVIYQIEGQEPQLLKAGDAFYEPAGPRILRFDNASATDEAVFIDFNLQQVGEPFIVFEETLTEDIDRRELPTTILNGKSVSRVDVFALELKPKSRKKIKPQGEILAYVAEGSVEIKTPKGEVRRVVAGKSFSINEGKTHFNRKTTITNDSASVKAKVITFTVR